MGLLNLVRPKWKHSDSDVRREAISSIGDPEILAEIIISDGEWFVRHEAFEALRDMKPEQTHYRRLVRESPDEEIRRKAVKVMTDESELERVAQEDKYQYIRDAAEHRLHELRTGLWDNLAS
ncbi:MAG: HEAT repeat domain-containing protein [Bryobacterales bacterium]|nr:HEAT repeat domain-containing protein [Bryobacterales bacterium]